MKTKVILIAFGVLVAVIVAQFFIYKSQKSFLEQENLELQQEKKEEIKKVRDSAFVKINDLTIDSQNKFDSILKISQKIKYIPYEKLIYPDRNLNDALDVISDYRYYEAPKRKN